MSGTASFEGRLHYVLGVRPRDARAGDWPRFGKLLDDEGYLAMRLEGDVRDPDLKPPKIEDILRGEAEDVIKEKLEGLFKKKKKKK